MATNLKISIIGAGSAFTLNIAETLTHPVFDGCNLILMDVCKASLERAEAAARSRVEKTENRILITTTSSIEKALEGCDYVIVTCEQDRYRNWATDIEIPALYGVHQWVGENGGPGGQIHAMRNICMLMPVVEAMKRLCPDGWLLNLTNPMSMLCTYLTKYTPIKSVGFCHQVHGTFGVIAEQLGFEPGELQVVSAGINHLNWLFDLRRRSTGKSHLKEFLESIKTSKWWREHHPNIPDQAFSLEIYRTFGMYPIGYDCHICEYLSCFYEKDEWEGHGIESYTTGYLKSKITEYGSTMDRIMKTQHLMLGGEVGLYPFPKDPSHSYYHETLCPVIAALETNEPLYLDAMVGPNHGAVSNLPHDAVVDRPVVVVGGQVRSIEVGELPPGPNEICRRQIALHDMVVKAVVEGDEKLAVQALCLDPYVRSISQARNIWSKFLEAYSAVLPTFRQ